MRAAPDAPCCPFPEATRICILAESMSWILRSAASAEPQSRRVERHQKGSVFQIGRALDEPIDFLSAEHGGQRLGTLAEGDHRDRPGDRDGMGIEKP